MLSGLPEQPVTGPSSAALWHAPPSSSAEVRGGPKGGAAVASNQMLQSLRLGLRALVQEGALSSTFQDTDTGKHDRRC